MGLDQIAETLMAGGSGVAGVLAVLLGLEKKEKLKILSDHNEFVKEATAVLGKISQSLEILKDRTKQK